MHAPGRKPARHLHPKKGRDLEADDTVEEPARLLCVDAVLVDFAGTGESVLNRPARDFVEDDAAEAPGIAANHLAEVPGDRLALAIEVGREVHVVRRLRELLEVADHLLLAGNHLVGSAPAVVRIDSHAPNELPALLLRPLGGSSTLLAPGRRFTAVGRLRSARTPPAADRQVADVTDARLHEVVASQVSVDRPGLGRGFHDYQRSRHAPPVTAAADQPPGGREPALR